MRPNIRVEIQNNLAEAMEVDENEEGEIPDDDEKSLLESQSSERQVRIYSFRRLFVNVCVLL